MIRRDKQHGWGGFGEERPCRAAYQGRQETVKLTINQDMNLAEEEIIINCAYADERIKKAADYIRQFFLSLECEKEGR